MIAEVANNQQEIVDLCKQAVQGALGVFRQRLNACMDQDELESNRGIIQRRKNGLLLFLDLLIEVTEVGIQKIPDPMGKLHNIRRVN